MRYMVRIERNRGDDSVIMPLPEGASEREAIDLAESYHKEGVAYTQAYKEVPRGTNMVWVSVSPKMVN